MVAALVGLAMGCREELGTFPLPGYWLPASQGSDLCRHRHESPVQGCELEPSLPEVQL